LTLAIWRSNDEEERLARLFGTALLSAPGRDIERPRRVTLPGPCVLLLGSIYG
jgi:hypothetical protein